MAALARGDAADVFQTPAQRRSELASDLVASSYLKGDFVLSSGESSDFYFDKYMFGTRPSLLRRLAAALAELVPHDADRIAAPELGAVPIATALSLETGLPFAIIRKPVKPAGEPGSIEGELHTGERVVLVEDVVTSGAETLRGVAALRLAQARVHRILAVVDREQGGAAAIESAGHAFGVLFRLGELPLPRL
jgi:orotate phosphoribosyltransferase